MADGDRVVVAADQDFADDESQDALLFLDTQPVESVGESAEESFEGVGELEVGLGVWGAKIRCAWKIRCLPDVRSRCSCRTRRRSLNAFPLAPIYEDRPGTAAALGRPAPQVWPPGVLNAAARARGCWCGWRGRRFASPVEQAEPTQSQILAATLHPS